MAPLRQSTKKGTKWEWYKTEQKAFKNVKESLSADIVMIYNKIGRAKEVIIDGGSIRPWGNSFMEKK